MTPSPYARAPDLSVTLSRIAVHYLTLIFHQHTEAKDVITSKSVQKIKTHIFCSATFFFFENHTVYEIMWKNIVQLSRARVATWRMRIAF
jgi:hypothetical protein